MSYDIQSIQVHHGAGVKRASEAMSFCLSRQSGQSGHQHASDDPAHTRAGLRQSGSQFVSAKIFDLNVSVRKEQYRLWMSAMFLPTGLGRQLL